ncbi:uncharacterized protein LOC120104414 isoform X2 [Phoenix dactylifera]|uniref:Uncharacterized protein LOC120104414 isoform X2 n=1 Tax=Phoenix dactylifera TaxID=42345 RepID=A0A8B8ZI48_PHODC|nr:uncharacterized protein LOC120104414 isoform X2 [Phoenix dactylifera]
MRSRRGRPLKELYDATRKLSEPEALLQGTCHIQGPIDEANYDLQRTDLGDFPVEGRHLLVNEKLCTRAEPGTCNVCSAPCISCLHLKRTVLIMESKIKDGLSHDTSGRKDDSSVIGDKVPNYSSRECDDQQHESSETSNFLSSTSSHNSCFENFESKARFRDLIRDDASEDVKTPYKESSDEAVKLLLEQTNVSSHSALPSHSQTRSGLHHKTHSDLVDEQHVLECHGDSISCISGITNASTAVHAPHMDSDDKNATSSIPSTGNLLARKSEKPVQNEAHPDCRIDEIKESQNEFQMPSTLLEESLQKNNGSSSAIAGSSPMYEHSEFHPSKSDNSSHCNYVSKERNACDQFPAVEIPKCLGNEESSLAQELVAGSIDGQENTARANSEINKESSTTSESASVSLKDTDACVGTEIGTGSRIPHPDCRIDEIKESQNEFQMPSTLLEESLQKNNGSSSAIAGSSPMYEHSEFHPSKSDNSSHCNYVSKERNACDQFPAVEIPKCLGNEESSLAQELVAGSIDGQENTARANSEINKESSTTSESASVSLKDTDACMGTEIGTGSRIPHPDCRIDEIKESQNEFQMPSTLLEESLQKNNGSSSAIAGSSPMYEHSEFHPSKSDNSSHCNYVSKERNACDQFPAVEIPKCLGNEESSLAQELVAGSIDGKENTARANSEINKESSTTSESASVSLKDTDACMGTEIGTGSRIPSDDAKKASFMKEPPGKSNLLLETANTQVSEIQPRTTSDNEIEDDVSAFPISKLSHIEYLI